MKTRHWLMIILVLATANLHAQFSEWETEHLRLIYLGQGQAYLAAHVARCFENSLQKHMAQYDYRPWEKVTLILFDFKDFGNAAAGAVPTDSIRLWVAPMSYVFESMPSCERMNYLMNHELTHVLTFDKAAPRDRLFRKLFFGKVTPRSDMPTTMLCGYLTTPRCLTPSWFQEGIAVAMETWRGGGMGRVFGGYDEMVFRTHVMEGEPLMDRMGLESAGAKIDFQVSLNWYVYGARFFSYLSLKYGPESIVKWVARTDDSKAYFASDFERVYGRSLDSAWQEWIRWEEQFQQANLEAIRRNPVTPHTVISDHPLGAVSSVFYEPAAKEMYMAVNYPGQVAHIAALNMENGQLRKLCDVKGPSHFYVSSLAYDRATRTIFFTSDNLDWRDLRSLDVQTGRTRTLLKDARVGNLAFNPADRSIWGVRHDSGVSTLVRIPFPYTEWNQVYTLQYGQDLYDIDISPDGKRLAGAWTEISGKQSLVMADTEALLAGDKTLATLYDFEYSSPANFVFSPDGKYLYGSSFYSGVSNIYRYDLETRDISPLTNCDTGFFRPVPLPDGSLAALRYTSKGFQPVKIPAQPVDKVSAITFLGQEIVDRYPVVKEWAVGSPAAVDLDKITLRKGDYHWLRSFRLDYLCPVVEGYKDSQAVGANFFFSDPILIHNLDVTVSYSPNGELKQSERLHARADFTYWSWQFHADYNLADFYDLFGPTKVGRKGYAVGAKYVKYLVFDEPNRYMYYTVYADDYGGLDRLPDYQNVAADFDKLFSFGFKFNYKYFRKSLGAVEDEKGYQWWATSHNNYVDGKFYPRLYSGFDYGIPLPISHSTLWLRSSAGKSFGDRESSFANFYFGGFGNNWVDHLNERRYREYYSFPGTEINEVGGSDFGKLVAEWSLPQIVLERAGRSACHLAWIKPALFASGLVTNMADADLRRSLLDVGGQVDFRLIVMSQYNLTVSVGYAGAFERHHAPAGEFMVSLKIQ